MSTINPFGKSVEKVTAQFCGKEVTIETGRVGFQSSTVTVRYGDTVIMGVGLAKEDPDPHASYFPLMIDYEEKMYAAGKISGSRFIKREGRPSDDAVLISRLIDRPIRPLFPKNYRNEVQGMALVLSLDPEVKADIPAMLAVSCALKMTGAPFAGPVAGVRVGLINDELVANPTVSQMKESKLDLFVAGTKEAIMMVEAGAQIVSEEVMVKALELAHTHIKEGVAVQTELISKLDVKMHQIVTIDDNQDLKERMENFISDKLDPLTDESTLAREEAVRALRDRVVEHFVPHEGEHDDNEDIEEVKEIFAHLMKQVVRQGILEREERPDRRGPEDIRPLSSEVGVLPRTHGSSIFTRGLTQAINITTLAPTSYAQVVDTMTRDEEVNFFHHYNFPGWSVGEIQRPRSTGRREIGHGHLAERALSAVIPTTEEFPYTIRTVSEITSSAGSTSMASVCSGCLSLMDAGVPIKAPVAGIAMGLVTDGEKEVVLSDIMDQEDFAGDMDFKVAGTADGITALQMDIKVQGLSTELLARALDQAKRARLQILDSMLATLPEYRKEMSAYAPRIETITVPEDKVREIIGKGGETINKIIDETGVEIDIKDGGIVMVAATDQAARDAAIQMINDITAEPEVGKTYTGKVVGIKDFGVFMEFMPGKEGMVHVSEMANERVEHPSDIVKMGDQGPVKVIGIDDQGRVKLSMKQA
ncbi:TPA: polyribonucleotide nucleotidyltransferase [Candidatus Saccharibacteria bacterium]|nr:polyribonucleotide nucleotidyltransferase [Candidatus Saccharibacteria bacterium]HIO87743.1 polyribonucleotide nucleotidyltransferase [Candidatus Saccharibacteria bacterium]